LGRRTTRLTVIDDTPASLATACNVGAECGSSVSAVLIGAKSSEYRSGMHDLACIEQMTALSFGLDQAEPGEPQG
jgi:hypothetical protein